MLGRNLVAIAIAIGMSVLGLTFLKSENKVQAHAAVTSNAFPGDRCTNVQFRAKNLHNQNGQIKITAVKAYNRASGNWYTIDVSEEVVEQGNVYVSNRNNIPDSEGEDITKVKFMYKWKGTGRGAAWSSEVVSKEFEPTSPTCVADKIYGNNGWEIGN